MNTIATFSFTRIILLDKHFIYRDGRKFAPHKWGILSNSRVEGNVEKCLKVSQNKKVGKSLRKVSTALEGKKDFNPHLK